MLFSMKKVLLLLAPLLAVLLLFSQAGAESDTSEVFGGLPFTPRTWVGAEKFLVHPQQLLSQGKRDSATILVDTRPAELYQRFHIPDSINIPLGFIKTKKFLADKPVVLIDNGFALSSLLDIQHELTDQGFSKVSILAGGIVGWLSSGGEINGDSYAAAQASLVAPAQLYLEAGWADLIVIDVSDPATAADFDHKLQLLKIPLKPEAEGAFSAAVTDLMAGRSVRSESLVIISDSGEWYDEIAKVLQGVRANIFYLEGGRTAYRAYLEKEDKLAHRSTQMAGERTCPVCPR